jgi:O-antigen ligase
MVGSAQKWVKRRPAILIAMVVAVVGIASFALFMDSGGSLLQSIGRNPTLTGRTKIWEAVLAQPINPLVGAGFESFWMGSRMQSVWDMSQYGIQQAHNGYLELYLNLGWIGIALLGALIITGYRNALPMYRIDPQFGRMRFGFITAAVVYGFTEAGFRMMSPDWFAFLLALILLPPASEEQPVTRASFIVHRAKERPEVRILQ